MGREYLPALSAVAEKTWPWVSVKDMTTADSLALALVCPFMVKLFWLVSTGAEAVSDSVMGSSGTGSTWVKPKESNTLFRAVLSAPLTLRPYTCMSTVMV